ncbi:hypothetical protein [Flavobacterium aciduliphilum]|uniref:Uncharacterized protein n=1 Tax=Flavobacterium aciduliphilum TaxID=1101402 RepID=A0A328YP14_9FLAO|nr:hypothetical protein [Flavobacterium aciduliphilum]RAR75801.1 hypothetical protein CLV55_101506 [Flavobacterium aciduliphilum]
MHFNSKFWLKFSLINLLIVALLGLLMRYKIGFEFPFFDQKHLQHSHSHFAFSGWISHALMVLMIGFLEKRIKKIENRFLEKYNKVLIANLICAYGMLVFFIIQGYGLFSIVFSTSSIVVACAFAYYFIKDLKLISNNDLSKNWFKAALFFNVISSLGTFVLAYMMVTKNIHQEEYLASIYYYLHFQYNGWFFFACMGLLFSFLQLKSDDNPFFKNVFKLFFAACIPAYFLSTLWLDLPIWIYILTVIAAFIQVYSWFRFLIIIIKSKREFIENFPFFLRYILLFVGFALSVKFLLQLGSTIPAISQLAFGFRPIVIAYLHLVLLAIISLFLLFYIYANHLIHFNQPIKIGLIIFSIGVLINEIILAIQGIASFSYTVIPFANEMLFGAAIILVSGIGITAYYSIKKVKNHPLL